MLILRWLNATQRLARLINPASTLLQTTQTVNLATKRHRDMTKEDMILEAIAEIRKGQIDMGKDVAVLNHVCSSIEELKMDMAVLKNKHDTGNRSDRAMVGISVFALLVSICVAITSCKGCINEEPKRSPYPISPNRLR